MKLLVTDGYTLNPGDLTWNGLAPFGELVYYDRTSKEEASSRCSDANIIITNKTIISADTIAAATNLQLIAVTATGFNIVDVAAARERGIPVVNVPLYGTDSVAQHVFALLLEITNAVGKHADSVRSGGWAGSKDFAYTLQPFIEIANKTIGIVGFGRIGQRVAAIAKAFGMKVIFYNKGITSPIAENVLLEELFAKSDFISLHCPLTKDTDSFVNKELLLFMKPSAFLINTSRGALINEKDLADALESGLLAGAALDVLRQEPPAHDNPLLKLNNCIITPHVAWISLEARQRLLATTIDNIQKFLEGTSVNVVNP